MRLPHERGARAPGRQHRDDALRSLAAALASVPNARSALRQLNDAVDAWQGGADLVAALPMPTLKSAAAQLWLVQRHVDRTTFTVAAAVLRAALDAAKERRLAELEGTALRRHAPMTTLRRSPEA